MKVLVVDDNQDLAFLLKWMLESEDLKPGSYGWPGWYSTYLLFSPDLVLTDIQMPTRMVWS